MQFDLPIQIEELKKLADKDSPEGTYFCTISAKALYDIFTEKQPHSILRDFSKPQEVK